MRDKKDGGTIVRQMARAIAIAAMLGLSGMSLSATSGQAADLGTLLVPVAPPSAGVPCIFEDWGPTIALPWPSIWLGHFAGGHFIKTAYGPFLEWKDEKVCFPSKAWCNRWIATNRRIFHRPEGDWTCLPIR
jgi:hypothetical protein